MTTRRPPGRLIIAWVALLAMLGLNLGLAYASLGQIAPLAHVLVSAGMAAIVLVVFMELDRAMPLFWVFAGAGFFWLAILFCLTAADFLTRYAYAPS